MSPSEHDLRSALHDGAGDEPNVDRVVAAARTHRRQVRTRVLSSAAAVVVVAAAAVGGTALVRSGGNGAGNGAGEGGGNGAAGGVTSPSPDAGSGQVSLGAPGERIPINGATGAAGNAPSQCPSRVPSTLLPGGGSPGQFGSGGKLFTTPVATMTVCAYPSGDSSSGATARIHLNGDDATTLANSLENAAKTKPGGACPTLRLASQRSIAIFAVSTDHTRLRTVTTTLDEVACAVTVTNGTAVRYAWLPPKSLQPQFAELVPGKRPVTTLPTAPPSRLHGSPISS